ncbi:hypothetical protein JAO76_02075 [Pontibacter sp. BT310]|uniref:Gliding motility-associated lipoprotein GldH n=1 Tax=Pontibacter populi TaxID=890055 RepID=A0ABS6X8I4_9BACT|nr:MULTISPECIES: hypothetical protein [Pontibacter]MBJ6116960.1 hypothetical protein [Pontibacter sp. BT310]MBR0569384.1 hypothetical protein [Microvirga sp. STS03]MBW3363813.1 hypothetical protein [Pontibacter populi]
MQKSLLIVVWLLLLISCNEKVAIDHTYQFYSLQVRPDSQLKITPQVNNDSTLRYYNYEIEHGNNSIFTLTYSSGDSIATDSGESDIVIFEVDTAKTEFNIVGTDFKNYSGLYEKSCFCFEEDANKPLPITQGQVFGKKLSSTTWKVRAEIGMIDIEDTVRVGQTKIISLK